MGDGPRGLQPDRERLFGLTNTEGNHGEDVKERHYFCLDSTPTHSYMKYLYKYPQAAYPYEDLVRINRQRSRLELEYELLDTGVFDNDRYFDVFVEYAKTSPEELLIQISVWNRGRNTSAKRCCARCWRQPRRWMTRHWIRRSRRWWRRSSSMRPRSGRASNIPSSIR